MLFDFATFEGFLDRELEALGFEQKVPQEAGRINRKKIHPVVCKNVTAGKKERVFFSSPFFYNLALDKNCAIGFGGGDNFFMSLLVNDEELFGLSWENLNQWCALHGFDDDDELFVESEVFFVICDAFVTWCSYELTKA